ncbi:DUF4352 domain-containing protein [Entomospira entomophila]|uniref:DUF4352 domain-containing protein n=1 Tax=Entomospira entomophila TaxID=2719988 RepID=A0A968G9B1_9SPIO|nr:DUF4352 domain-containing protein [Entomospira entomophilus]NIZ40195.1 DUF4352 domain-containing protein [Entomospira entomophilus]WDI35754.1 DUF4352 domain-containing protein [Entomospira entomophilus]
MKKLVMWISCLVFSTSGVLANDHVRIKDIDVVPIGETMQTPNALAIRVNSVRISKIYSQFDFMRASLGYFLGVELTITNQGDAPITIDSKSYFSIADAGGQLINGKVKIGKNRETIEPNATLIRLFYFDTTKEKSYYLLFRAGDSFTHAFRILKKDIVEVEEL